MAEVLDQNMAQAMECLEYIFSEFKKHGQRQSANELGRLCNMIADVYLETQAHISDINKGAISGHQIVDRHAAPRNTTLLEEQAVRALLSEAEKAQSDAASTKSSTMQPLPAPKMPATQQDSWAQVASTTSHQLEILPLPKKAVQSDIWTGSLPVIPGPSRAATQILSPSMTPSPTVHSNSGSIRQSPNSPAIPTELPLPQQKAGVIRINGLVSKDSINSITDRIHEGPLLEIRVETNQRTKIVFQHLTHARAFLQSDQDMVAILGYGRFGAGYQTELVEVLNWNEDLHRMCPPTRERRRLSFARKRLFADNVSPERWKHDIRSIAGPGNVDRLWVFNSGNATAIFTSTSVARKVLESFSRWSQVPRGVYSELSVTFSSDPCEKPLSLIKDNNGPSNHGGRYIPRKAIR